MRPRVPVGVLLRRVARLTARPRLGRPIACSWFPELDPDAAEEIAGTAGGLPFTMVEMARVRLPGPRPLATVLPPPALRTFQRLNS
jgi:hypothetical protein